MENKSNQGFLEKVFHLSENHTDVKTEVIAGITTFMTMAYILAVNPNILSATGMDRGAVFTATALASLVATLLMLHLPIILLCWRRHGTECLLCIHRSTPDGLYLADGSGSRICGRPYLYRTVSYQCA